MAKKKSTTLRNAGGIQFVALKGVFVLRKGLEPDGDSIHFAASQTPKSGDIRIEVKRDQTDGMTSKMLRLQSIDAPEKKQPMGAHSRNALLGLLKINPASVGLGNTDFTVGDNLVKIPGWIATQGVDNFRRQLSYLFLGNPGLKNNEVISADDLEATLKQSLNYKLVANGMVFPAAYQNTDEAHAVLFQKAANDARARKKGVWATDKTTTGFIPTESKLNAGGALVYPKFYRRVAKWKNSTASASAFINWLKNQDDGKKLVEGAEPNPVALWKLFEKVDKSRVCVPYDVTKLWFSN